MDLPKVFDTMNSNLLLAKLKAYGFSDQVLSLLQSYLSNIFRKSIINGSLLAGMRFNPQGSILDPLLFNIILNNVFLFISKYQLCQ